MTPRHAILDRKAAELKAELTRWALQSQILDPGEVVVFSLRIESREVVSVERDQADALDFAAEELPLRDKLPPVTSKFKKHIAPAMLTPAQVREILGLYRDSEESNMRHLLVNHRNNPTEIDYQITSKMNAKLRDHPIGGKRYRIASYHGKYQLWEAE